MLGVRVLGTGYLLNRNSTIWGVNYAYAKPEFTTGGRLCHSYILGSVWSMCINTGFQHSDYHREGGTISSGMHVPNKLNKQKKNHREGVRDCWGGLETMGRRVTYIYKKW